jgi:hypothetical protein
MPQRMPALTACCKKPIIAANVVFCGCCMIGRQCVALEGVPNQMSIGYCLGSFIAYPVCVCCIRKKVSDKYDLGENCCVSLLASIFLPCCSLIQTHKIFRRNGVPPGLMCGAIKVDQMTDDQRNHYYTERQQRRNERAERNRKRRQIRNAPDGTGAASDSSSDSDDGMK